MKYRDLAGEVLAQRDRDGVRGLDRELSRFRCHIQDELFAQKELSELTHRDIREWLRHMADKNAQGPGTKRKLSRQTINRSGLFDRVVQRLLGETRAVS